MRTFRKHKRNGGTRRKSVQAMDKEQAVAMVRSFESDYKRACQSRNPQLLEAHFEALSNDHLKQLCNSAKISETETSRNNRIKALAAELLKRKTTVQKALQVILLIIRFQGAMAFIAVTLCYYRWATRLVADSAFLPLVLVCLFSMVYAGDSLVTFVRSCKNFGKPKSKRRILRQMRQLNDQTK